MSSRGNGNNRGRGRGGRGGPGGGRGHPGHLKGRAIGLWYASRNKAKKEEDYFEPSISLPQQKIGEIRTLLNESHFVLDGDVGNTNNTANSKKFQEDFERAVSVNIEEQILLKIALKLDEENNASNKSSMGTSSFDKYLEENLKISENTKEPTKLQEFRKTLPCWKKREEIIRIINENQVILIKGETGCGKTTQVTQYILDDAISRGMGSKTRIVCTQPRRISAITVAERVAAERGEVLGNSVGYSIRLEGIYPRKEGGSIKYCTTGVLLKYMEDDPALFDYSHIILDEVHERDTHSDVALGILKKLISHRSDLKVILMSATLKAEVFSKYFNDCPNIEIEGFTFPVKEKYLEDILQELQYFNFPPPENPTQRRFYGRRREEEQDPINLFELFQPTISELRSKYSPKVIETLMNPMSEKVDYDFLETLLFHISYKCPEGAVLVFLPGYAQISKLAEKLRNARNRFPESKFRVLPLHSMLAGVDQKKVFDRPPLGVRKIILATNIAETSITIDDVVYVVNAGKRKITNFDVENNIEVLEEVWVSKANASQRKGRAGRCQPGVCYHLYSRARAATFETDIVPEILRTRLHDTILNLKLLGFQNVMEFLCALIDVPNSIVIQNSIDLLKRISALTTTETLTPLGYHLAKLPVEPQAGKMILLAAFFSCLDPITSIAASLSYKDAFYTVMGKEQETDRAKLRFARNSKSDHLMVANVMDTWKTEKHKKPYQFCRENFLSFQTLTQLESMKKQFEEFIKASKLSGNSNSNKHSGDQRLVRAIICSALYPNIAKVFKVRRRGNNAIGMPSICTKEEGRRVKIYPGSVLANECNFDSNYLVYYQKQKSREVYLYDCSTISPYALLFWGDLIVSTDEWIGVADFLKFKCNKETQQLILELRDEWNLLLQKKIWNASPVDWNGGEGKLMKAIIRLITTDKNTVFDETDESD